MDVHILVVNNNYENLEVRKEHLESGAKSDIPKISERFPKKYHLVAEKAVLGYRYPSR